MRLPGSAIFWCALATAAFAACAGVQRVALLSQTGLPVTSAPIGPPPLEVVTRATAIPNPLPVRGSSVVYTDIEPAVGLAVSSASAPWAEAHRDKRPDGWRLVVEIVRAEADEATGHLNVAIDVRATLRGRDDDVLLGETSAHCQEAGVAEAANGASVVYSCMTQLGQDLTSWLAALQS